MWLMPIWLVPLLHRSKGRRMNAREFGLMTNCEHDPRIASLAATLVINRHTAVHE